MPIHHAVLALLADQPGYGYELKSRFEKAVGPQFGALNIGHVYQILERLERDGMVTRRLVHQSDKPDKAVYRLTPKGRAELMDWVALPHLRTSGFRDDFFLKLAAASGLGKDTVAVLLTAQRRAYLQELSMLDELRRNASDDPVVQLLLKAAILHTEASLRVVDAAEGLDLAESKSSDRDRHPEEDDAQSWGADTESGSESSA